MPDRSLSLEALIYAPTANDAVVAAGVLRDAQISARACASIEEICEGIAKGCGVLILSEDGLTAAAVESLKSALENQPKWSDVPVLLLTGVDVVRASEHFSKSGNIFLLERPFSKLTLIRSVEVALRARSKQYEVRNLLVELQESKDEADRANFAKSQFLANMSHEIRTPIGAIMGFLDILKNSRLHTDEDQQYMTVIDRNSRQLLRLINDILDLSKVEAGKMEVENIGFSLGDLLAELISNANFKAREKGIAFKLGMLTMIPRRIVSDPTRIRQILMNILSNAVKFTEQGLISIDVSYVDGLLKFEVTDSGVGLTAEQVGRLFKPFAQADSSTTRKFGGTGLGLMLSRSLAENLGGSLDLVWSEPGQGAKFEIRLKVAPEEGSEMIGLRDISLEASEPKRDIKIDLTGTKILLVEDSPDNQVLVSMFLRRVGADLQVASNGAEGVELALGSDFDVVLMDLQMPVMDGHAATQELRRKSFKKPIIALTAHAMREEVDRCAKSGFSDYVTKPIQPEILIQAVASFSGHGAIKSRNGLH